VLSVKYTNVSAAISFSEQVTVPTLFVKGSKSDYITEEDEVEIAKSFKRAKVVEIEDAGHWVHAEQPIRLLDEVKQFLA